MLHWSALLVFLAVTVVGLWVAYSFLNKNGLYWFCILASLLAINLGSVSLFSHQIPLLVVMFPVIHFALLVCLHKFGEKETKNLFFVTILSMAIVFVFNFFEGAYYDAALQVPYFLTWDFLGLFIAPLLSFSVACVLNFLFVSKIKFKSLKKFLVVAIFVAIASFIDVLLYDILIYAGVLSFVDILLTILIELVLICIIAIGLGYFEKYLNREPKPAEEPKQEKKEEPKQEQPANEEDNLPKDID